MQPRPGPAMHHPACQLPLRHPPTCILSMRCREAGVVQVPSSLKGPQVQPDTQVKLQLSPRACASSACGSVHY